MRIVLVLLLTVLPLFALEEKEGIDAVSEVQSLRIKAEEKWAKEDYMGAAKLYKKAARKLDKPVFKADMLLKEAECYFEANKTHRATEAFRALMKDYALYVPYDVAVERLRSLVGGKSAAWRQYCTLRQMAQNKAVKSFLCKCGAEFLDVLNLRLAHKRWQLKPYFLQHRAAYLVCCQ